MGQVEYHKTEIIIPSFQIRSIQEKIIPVIERRQDRYGLYIVTSVC